MDNTEGQRSVTNFQALIHDGGELLKAGAERVKHLPQATDRTIRNHPYPSLGIAFGIGILIGVLVGRRGRH